MPIPELVAVLAVLLGAATQSVTGLGFSLVSVPLLTIALGGDDGVRFANLLSIAVNLLLLAREHGHVDLRHVLSLLVPATVAAPLTAWAIRDASSDALSVASGVLILVAVAALATGLRIRRLVGRVGAVAAGAASGAMTVVGGVGGPAVASYAVNAGWQPLHMRPTLAAHFLGINVVSVAARGVPDAGGGLIGAAVAAVVVGFAAGAVLARGLDPVAVRRATLVVAAVGGLGAIVEGLR